ncbi:hypothetical protein H6P81_013518 [Aristolochia fimbriata]|uniref:Ribosomal protein/NADH dehydrogenase domain-containing protein n=1 Tax=Aristolochia fimbriata TaxID=158543 RepID=A0AAV7EEX3_ARIFI|nr:hypothetical protein H6P81_013518 [Aristolochia fimbriata]
MAWRANLSRNLKELRFLYCQTSPESALTREFVHWNYKDFKTLNPKFPILIRESSGAKPQVWARYDMGIERYVNLDDLKNEAEITAAVQALVRAANDIKV